MYDIEITNIDQALAHLGVIVRRARAETLDEQTFEARAALIRSCLTTARNALVAEAEALLGDFGDDAPIELKDAGEAVAVAASLGSSPQVQTLLRRIPEVMTARRLQEAGVIAKRRRGSIALIEGGAP